MLVLDKLIKKKRKEKKRKRRFRITRKRLLVALIMEINYMCNNVHHICLPCSRISFMGAENHTFHLELLYDKHQVQRLAHGGHLINIHGANDGVKVRTLEQK